MRTAYTKPLMEYEKFVAGDYVAACYNFFCQQCEKSIPFTMENGNTTPLVAVREFGKIGAGSSGQGGTQNHRYVLSQVCPKLSSSSGEGGPTIGDGDQATYYPWVIDDENKIGMGTNIYDSEQQYELENSDYHFSAGTTYAGIISDAKAS